MTIKSERKYMWENDMLYRLNLVLALFNYWIFKTDLLLLFMRFVCKQKKRLHTSRYAVSGIILYNTIKTPNRLGEFISL